jgi:transcriptional regulator with XRE-family HTH domain
MPREGRAAEGGRRWAETIAANVRHERRVRDWSQDDLADRMTGLGYAWTQRIVSYVERAGRDLTVDELFGLAMLYGVEPLDLMDPRGPRQDATEPLRFGRSSVTPRLAAAWLHGDVHVTHGDGYLSWEPVTDEGTEAIFEWRASRDDEEDDR